MTSDGAGTSSLRCSKYNAAASHAYETCRISSSLLVLKLWGNHVFSGLARNARASSLARLRSNREASRHLFCFESNTSAIGDGSVHKPKPRIAIDTPAKKVAPSSRRSRLAVKVSDLL